MKGNKISLVAASTVFFIAAAQAASAQERDSIYGHSAAYKSSWGLNAEVINFDIEAARQRGLKDTGYGLGVNYHGEVNIFNFDMGASYFYVEDNNLTRLIDREKRKYNSTSGTTGYALHIDGGLQLPVADNLMVGLNAGYRHFDIDSSIDKYEGVSSEPIDIDGNTYLKPFVKMNFSEQFDAKLTYFHYLEDAGVDNSYQLSFNWRI